MDSQPRRELAALIAQEGVGLADDPQRIKALLMDRCPESRTEMGLLVAAAEDEIPSRLARAGDSIFRDGEIARAVMDLKQRRRLDQSAAEWVVRSWAWALGILDEEPVDDLDGSAPTAALGSDGSFGPDSFTSPVAGQTGQSNPAGQSGPYPVSGPQQYWAGQSAPSVGHSSPSGRHSTPSGSDSTPSGTTGPYSSTSLPNGPTDYPSGPSAQSAPPPWMFDQATANTAASWAGSTQGSNGPNTGWPPASQPPQAPPQNGNQPGGSRRKPYAIAAAIGGAVLVVAIVVGAVILTRPVDSTGGGGQPTFIPGPTPESTPITVPTTPPTTVVTTVVTTSVAPTTTSVAMVDFQITDTLGDWQLSETATIFSGGDELGKLKVDLTSTTDYIILEAPPGPVNYELEVWFQFKSSSGEILDYTVNGRGVINVYEGAKFPIQIEQVGEDFVATLG